MSIVESKKIKKITTKLKFVKSEKTGKLIGFVTQDPKSGYISGVRENDPRPKKVVLIDKLIVDSVLTEVLYECVLVPMENSKGYIAISCTPVQFTPVIDVTYVPKIIYKVKVQFGNHSLTFDPMNTKNPSRSVFKICRAELEKRMDIKNLQDFLVDFDEAVLGILKRYEADGFYVKSKIASKA